MKRSRSLLLILLALALALATVPTGAAAKERFVALSPFTANTLVGVGVKPIAIGNTLGGEARFSSKLRGVKRLELSHPNGPNLEELAMLNPSFVLSSPVWNKGHPAMKKLGMKVQNFDPIKVDDVPRTSRQLGRIAGKAEAGQRLARRQIRSIKRARSGIKKRPTVLLLLGVGRTPYAFLPNSWGGDVVTKAGGRMLTKGLTNSGGFAQISNEYVVEQNPDVIIVVPHGNGKDIPTIARYMANNPAWQTTKAVRNKRVYLSTGNSLLQAYTDVDRTIRDVRRRFLRNG